jgi:hypothetical protein
MTTPTWIRVCAVAAPILLLLYGVLHLIDGTDRGQGSGFAWNVGHTLFFLGFILFGVLTVGLRRAVGPGLVANVATAATLFGAACFLWVIVGDVFAGVRESAPLPEALELVGPLAFQLGTLALLTMLVIAKRLPLWSPVLVMAGFVLFAVNLDLLPVGALLLLAGFAPLTGLGGGTRAA